MTFLFFVMFSWFVVKAKTRRQVLALALVGTTASSACRSATRSGADQLGGGYPGGPQRYQWSHPFGT